MTPSDLKDMKTIVNNMICPKSFFVTSLLLFMFCPGAHLLTCKVNIDDKASDTLSQLNCSVVLRKEESCHYEILIRNNPGLFDTSSGFPPPPNSLKILPFYRKYSNSYFPGGDVVLWPSIFGSPEIVRGFFVNISRPRSRSCLLIKLQDGHNITAKHRDAHLNFSVELWPLEYKRAEEYVFKGYSLPMPEERKFPNTRLFEAAYMKTGTSWSGSSALDWRPMIAYNNVSSNNQQAIKSMKVEGSFSPAPVTFKIPKYVIKLLRVTSGTKLQDEEYIQEDEKLTTQTDFEFNNIHNSGYYRIQVAPYQSEGCGEQFCSKDQECHACLKTNTLRFLLLKDGETIPIVPTAVPADPSTRTVSSSNSLSNSATWSSSATLSSSSVMSEEIPTDSLHPVYQILIGVFTCLLVAILAGVLIFMKRCYKDGSEGDAPVIPCKKKTRAPLVVAVKGVPRKNNTASVLNNEKTKELTPKRKCVYLVHADDNKFHNQVMRMFATYLQKHCMCDVLYHPWCNTDKYRWMVNALEKADFTVLVTSKSAFNQYQVWKHPDSKLASELNGTNDFFLPAFRLLCKRLTDTPNFSEKLLTVYFDYSSEKQIPTDIYSSGQYKLLECFDSFILRIHGRSSYMDGGIGCYMKTDLSKTSEGKALLEAVKKAKKKYLVEYNRSDSGFDSISKSLQEDDLNYVRMKYLEEHSVSDEQSQAGDIQWGVFSINKEDCGSLLGQNDPSICPAETILHGDLDNNCIVWAQANNHDCAQHPQVCHQSLGMSGIPLSNHYVHPVSPVQECVPMCCSGDVSCKRCELSCANFVNQNMYMPMSTKDFCSNSQPYSESDSKGFTGFEGFSGPDDPEFIAPDLSECGDISSHILEQQIENINQRYFQHMADCDNLQHPSQQIDQNCLVNIACVSEKPNKYNCPTNIGLNEVGLNIGHPEMSDPTAGIDFYPPETDESSIENNDEVGSIGGQSF